MKKYNKHWLLVTMISLLFIGQNILAQTDINCVEAVAAVDGVNSLDASDTIEYYWYTYTMPGDGKLQITSSSDNYVYILNGTCDNLGFLAGDLAGITVNTLESGDIVYIMWVTSSGVDFDWNLSVLPLESGDNCELAVAAVDGVNSLPATTSNEYWYTYTMPSDGKLQITSSVEDNINVYDGSCNNLAYIGGGNGNSTITSLSAGDVLYIRWDIWNDGDFDWNLSVAPLEAGDNCELAVAAVDGVNSFPATTGSEYWYTYTMPIDGKLRITSSVDAYIIVYNGSCNNLYYQGEGYSNATITSLSAGDVVSIMWDIYNGGNFDWNLSALPLEPGDNCELAVTAVDGVNSLPATTVYEYWYTYTMPSDGKLQITSSSGENVRAYSGDCSNLYYIEYSNSNLTLTTLSEADVVYIKWNTYNGGNFDWNLSVVPLEPGDNCELAVAAVDGVNSFPATTGSEYWYTYTMPSDGKLQITSSAEGFVRVLTGTCDNLDYIAGDFTGVSVNTLKSGDIVYIYWEPFNGGNFDWNLSVVPLEPGDNCDLAAVALDGVNSLPPTTSNEYWYRYTMPSDGKLQITSSAGEYVSAFTGDCSNLYHIGQLRNNLTLTTLSVGDEVYIRWNTYDGGNFDWNLSVLPYEPGEKCELAVTAVDGVNSLPATTSYEYWYTYTMPIDGKLQITSSADGYIVVFKGSCNNLEYIGDGYENTTITSLSAGDIVYINWNTSNGGDFDWNISVAPLEAGDNCELAVAAVDGVNSLPAISSYEYWYTYTMPSDGKLQITSSADASITVFSGSCNNLYYKGDGYVNSTITSLSAGDFVYILWETNNGGNFDWNLSALPLEPGDNCELAVAAVDGVNSFPATTGSEYWYTYTMPIDGKLQIISSADAYIVVFNGSCNNLEYIGDGYENTTITSISAGDVVYIMWEIYNGGNFDWNISALPFEPGDKCELAATAVDGFNSLPATTNSVYWYTYTMPSDGKLQITSSSGQYVYVYIGDCSDLYGIESSRNNLTITTLSEGDEVYLKWNTYNGGNFDWNLSVLPLEPGDNCELAVTAVDGVNLLPPTTSNEYWYTYTMPSDGKLQITSSADGSIYVLKGTCDNLDYIAGDWGGVTVNTLMSGDIVYILWELHSGGNFDWNLSVLPFEVGDKCDLAAVALDGVNSLPPTISNEYWYRYTMPSDGKLQITSSIDASIVVYRGSCNYLDYEEDGWSSIIVKTLKSGDEVYIRWDTYNGGDFDWNLSVLPFQPGDNCEFAVSAVDGVNSLPPTTSYEYWYTYTIPSVGKLQITSSEDNYVKVMKGDCSDLDTEESGYGELTLTSFSSEDDIGIMTTYTPLAPGDVVFIQWRTYSVGDFDWNLSVVPLEAGDNCSEAVTAIEGANTVPGLDNEQSYWYKYTVATQGKLVITTTSDNYVIVYSGDCANMNYKVEGENVIDITNLYVGDVIYFQWEVDDGGNFDWELTTETVEAAEDCSMAATAIEGVNSLPVTDLNQYWYSFTMPATGGRLEISSDDDNQIIAFTNSCNYSDFVAVGYGNISLGSLAAEEEVFILWESYGGGDFDWNLSVVPLETGDNCSIAAVATISSNSAPRTDYWFSFEAPSTGNYILSANGANMNEPYLRVYSECGGSMLAGGYEDDQISLSLTTGDNIFILCSDWESITGYDLNIAKEGVVLLDQTITFDAIADKTYGDADINLSASASSGLDVIFEIISGPATISGNTLSIIGAGSITIRAKQSGNETYKAASLQQSFAVAKADQQISIEPILEKSINDPAFGIVASSTSSLDISYSVSGPASVSGSTITLDGTIGTVTVTVTQDGNENYNAATADATFSVTGKSSQTISFNAIADKTYGDADFILVASASSGLDVIFEIVSGPATLSGNTVNITGAGEVSIRASQLGNNTFAAASELATFTVNKADQQISFDDIADQILEDGSIDLVASSSSELTVSFAVISGSATLVSNSLSFSNTGTVTVEASQDGNDNYNAADPVQQSFEVSSNTNISENLDGGIEVYPNPVANTLILKIDNLAVEKIQLVSADGHIAAEFNADDRVFNFSNYPPGLYLLKVNSFDKVHVKRIIKK